MGILPIFHGFDESAHYSSIRQIAYTGTIPIYGASFYDRAVEDYRLPPISPMYYAEQESFQKAHRSLCQLAEPPSYSPGNALNYEAQHPPLYYLLLSPLEKALGSLSFQWRVF